jgi:hypothetical protein
MKLNPKRMDGALIIVGIMWIVASIVTVIIVAPTQLSLVAAASCGGWLAGLGYGAVAHQRWLDKQDAAPKGSTK